MSADHLIDKHLPNLEDPSDEITRWDSRPKPVGFGTVDRSWQPRRAFAGTYDQQWQRERAPLYPDDLDLRFFQAAHPDLVMTPHLRGGERVELLGLTMDGEMAFNLPKITLGFRTFLEGVWQYHGAKLSFLIIEPDVSRLMLVWQSYLPCHGKRFKLDETEIYEKRLIS